MEFVAIEFFEQGRGDEDGGPVRSDGRRDGNVVGAGEAHAAMHTAEGEGLSSAGAELRGAIEGTGSDAVKEDGT